MEKRAAERFDMRVPATVFVEGELQEMLTLQTENVSSRGTFLQTDHLIPQGAEVEVELLLPLAKWTQLLGPDGRVKVTVSGKVIRTEQHGIAIQFDRQYSIQPTLEEIDARKGDRRSDG